MLLANRSDGTKKYRDRSIAEKMACHSENVFTVTCAVSRLGKSPNSVGYHAVTSRGAKKIHGAIKVRRSDRSLPKCLILAIPISSKIIVEIKFRPQLCEEKSAPSPLSRMRIAGRSEQLSTGDTMSPYNAQILTALTISKVKTHLPKTGINLKMNFEYHRDLDMFKTRFTVKYSEI